MGKVAEQLFPSTNRTVIPAQAGIPSLIWILQNNSYLIQNVFDMKNGGIVYIITNKYRTVLYIGVTNNIKRRMLEHKKGMNKGFAQKYNCTYLLYFEPFWDIADAIQRETVIKRWKRNWKIELIKKVNPNLLDLSREWFNEQGNLKESLTMNMH